MSTAEILYPINLPKCEAVRESNYANDTPQTNKSCKWAAKYQIDGHNFCTKHAGIVSLQILLKETHERRKS